MSCLNKDRKRSEIVNFRVTPIERQQIEARIKVLGLPKGEYFIRTFMQQSIKIVAGQYQSNRLSLELARLSNQLASIESNEGIELLLQEYRALLNELLIICRNEDVNSDQIETISESSEYE